MPTIYPTIYSFTRLLIRACRDGANDVLEEYYKKTGGRPKKPTAKPGPKPGLGRKRKSTGDSKSVTPSATDVTEPKRRRKSAKAEETPVETDLEMDDWVPKSNNWEKELQSVDTIIRDPENNGLYAFILWKNGKRSRVSIESCYEKCPRKVSASIVEAMVDMTRLLTA